MNQNPHADQPVLRAGAPALAARLAVVLVHGRGSSAEDILGVVEALALPDVLYLAPQAADHTWYPYPFLAPIAQNEPYLSSALDRLATLIQMLGAEGLPPERVGLLGFSQGACLSLEYAARHARRYAGVVGFSGAVIGPPDTPRNYAGSLDSTPVFIGCSDVDAHIPVQRVHESAEVLRGLGAVVDERIYPGMGHTINRDEIQAVRAMLS